VRPPTQSVLDIRDVIPAGSIPADVHRSKGRVKCRRQRRHCGDLFCAPEYAPERGDHEAIDRFSVSSIGYTQTVYILLVYEQRNIQRQSRLYTRDTFACYTNVVLFLYPWECETWENTKYNLLRWLIFLWIFHY